MPPLLTRLLSPSGFALTLLLLLLPFVGVSCSDPNLGTLDGSYTGFDLAAGGSPSYDAAGPIADMPSTDRPVFPDPGAQVLTILLIVLLVAGLATALLPVVRVRALAGAGIAVLAAVLLAVIQFVAQSNLVTSMQNLLLVHIFSVPQELSAVATKEYLSDATGSRIGFWLGLVTLLAVAAVNAVNAVAGRARRVPGSGAP